MLLKQFDTKNITDDSMLSRNLELQLLALTRDDRLEDLVNVAHFLALGDYPARTFLFVCRLKRKRIKLSQTNSI